MKSAALPAVLLALLLLPACARDPLQGLAAFEGEWTGTHKILGDPAEYPATYSVRRDGEALVWDFQSGFQGGFTGRAQQRWDAERGLFVESWTDSATPDAATEVSGGFDARTGVLLMSGTAPDWASGAPVGYRHETTILSQDEWKYAMHQEQADGAYREVMWIHMIRRP